MTKEKFIQNLENKVGTIFSLADMIVCASKAWDAATEEVKKDHFKIGEEVEARKDDSSKWHKCFVVLSERGIGLVRKNVRRIPAWEPKEGDAVFVRDDNLQIHIAKVKTRAIYGTCILVFADGDECPWEVEDVKPFNPSKIGKPWEEV